MLKIGITGGIGSGKSTVCKLFELLGISVFYADDIAKNIMNADSELKESVIKEFGLNSYSEAGLLNRKYIADIVFKSTERLAVLNSLVHPAVFRAFATWHSSQNSPYIIKEAALLFESESYKTCDYSILVEAPLDLKVKRVMERDQLTALEVELRMAKQFTDEQKRKLANFTLLNDEKHLLITQVLDLHQHILSLLSTTK
ncbi:MAG: dephospho-CoA kinase [Sphingobacteriales bacterium]|nr:dephospho-CoA kinase [Sphingobacteriales bacterium]